MDSPAIRSLVASSLQDARRIRHDLHRHPELSFAEARTSAAVQRELASMGVKFVAGLGAPRPGQPGHGVLGFLPATTGSNPPTVALRADMDALPIGEETGADYASSTPGVMHACGHDGHTTILLFAARALSKVAERPNNVLFIFQPAEEGGAGAEKMCRDGALDGRHFGQGTKANAVFGLHGWPELELNTLATREGPLLAATDDFRVIIHGRGCHAAQPHLGADPIVCASALVTALQTISSRRFNPFEPVVVTVGEFHAGSANNIIPPSAMLHGTVRTLCDDARALAEAELRRIVEGICAAHACTPELIFHRGYPVTRNAPGAVKHLRSVARSLGHLPVVERQHPTMGGEDFAYYGPHAPAAFFFLGLRPPGMNEYPGLHTPRFDFNDDALAAGIEIMTALALTPLAV